MTDYLADVVMPEQPVEEPVEEPIVGTEGSVDEPSEDKELELEEEEEEVITEPVKKEKISQEEIFAPPKVLPVSKPKQTRKKGRVMSEKQLQALAAARAKGIETRRRNAAEKKKMKEMEQEEKNLIKEQKVKKFNKLKKAVEEDIDEAGAEHPTPSVKVVEKERIVEKGYSQEQLDAAVLEAVERSVNRVEVLRKERKAVKKQAQAKEQHDAKVFKEINSALKKPDVWDSCFM